MKTRLVSGQDYSWTEDPGLDKWRKLMHWAAGHIYGCFLTVDQCDSPLLALVVVIAVPSQTVF